MKVLIVGLGSIAQKHILALQAISSSNNIYALRSNIGAKEHEGVTNIYDCDEIDYESIDFIIISSPTGRHKSDIEKFSRYKTPLFIEKPISNILTMETLVEKVLDNKIYSYVGCNLRFLDSLVFTKEYLDLNDPLKEHLNEVNVYCGSYLPSWRKGGDYKENYSANENLGGGVHLDLIHELDYVYWFFGSPLKVKRTLSSKSGLNISSVDYANYLLEYNGFNVNIILNYYRKLPQRTLELVFENNILNIDLIKNSVDCNGENIYSSGQRIQDTYYQQMKYVSNSIRTDNDSFNTIKNGFEVLKICLDN